MQGEWKRIDFGLGFDLNGWFLLETCRVLKIKVLLDINQ